MKLHRRTLFAAVIFAGLVGTACGTEATAGPAADVRKGDAVAGQSLFQNNCARCHGELGVGTSSGPSFMSSVYVPSHHGDEAFQRAAALGVQPHHWDFGPMPVITGVDRDDVADIIAYVRQLQTEAGLIQ